MLIPSAFLTEFLNFCFQVLLFLQEFFLFFLHFLLCLFSLDRNILNCFQDLLQQNKRHTIREQSSQ